MVALPALAALIAPAIAEPVYTVEPIPDGSIILTTAVISLIERRFFPQDAKVTPACTLTSDSLCDASELHPLDASVIGRWDEDWAMVTDVALIGAMSLPYALLLSDSLLSSSPGSMTDVAADSAVVLESFLISNVAVVTLKYAMRRPRPTQYTDVAPAEAFGTLEHQLSFPSGHAAAVGSAMTATAATYWLRHPDSPVRWAVAGGALGLTTLTAVGRVQAGKHFPSDVVAGAMLGTSIGLLIPWMHKSDYRLDASVTPIPNGARMTLQGTLPSLAAQARSR